MLANTGGSGGGGHTAAKTSHAHATSYAAAPHPVTQYTQDVVSHMAAQHAAAVISHMAHIHHNGHGPSGVHTPSLEGFAHGHQVSSPLQKAIAQMVAASMQDPSMYGQQPQPQGPMTWNGSQWVPAPVAHAQFQPQYQGQQAPPSYAGNNSIAQPGGGGIMDIINQIAGIG